MSPKAEYHSKPESSNGNPEKYFTLWLDRLESSVDLRFESLVGLLNERDKRYEERHANATEATRVALESLRNATGLALSSADKASEKSGAAQDQYNKTHNDLLKKMDQQHESTLPRVEAMQRFDRLETDMRVLREYRSATEGRVIEKSDSQTQSNWSIGVIVAVVLALFALALPIIMKLVKP